MNWKIPLVKMYWEKDDIAAVEKVIRRGTYWATGPEIKEFEERVAEFSDIKYAIAFNSGTSALHSLLLAYDVTNKEVIVPSFTFIATSNTVILANGKPIFAEIEDTSYGLDSEDVKERITDKTKAIIPVHYGGAPCKEIETLKEIAEDHNLLLIEDAAESLGAKIRKKKVGTFGDSAIFSFCQNKVITTGEGGMVVTDDKEICEKLKLIRSHGRLEKGRDYFSNTESMDYTMIGYNYRMPTMIAALGISQLNKIQKVINMRRDSAKYLNEKLSRINGLTVPEAPKGHYHVYQMYTIQLKDKKQRDSLQEHLTRKGIMAKIYFDPVHLMTIYKKMFGCNEGNLPKTEEISKKILTLPMYAGLKEKEVEDMVKSIKEFFDKI